MLSTLLAVNTEVMEQVVVDNTSCKIAVLGLGNPMRTDDGVGLDAAYRLLADDRLPGNVQVIEGGTLGLDLLHSLRGITHLLVLDAVDTGASPGTLSRFADEELIHLPIAKSVHLLGFADLLGTLKLLEDEPGEVVLLGVQPESTDWGITLSPIVDTTLNDLVEAALDQISKWLNTAAEQKKPCVLQSRAK
jgi:hydrogenase maturation protease